MVGHGGSSAGSHLADPTSPIPSHCASIVATSTLRVKTLFLIEEMSEVMCDQICHCHYYTNSAQYDSFSCLSLLTHFTLIVTIATVDYMVSIEINLLFALSKFR